MNAAQIATATYAELRDRFAVLMATNIRKVTPDEMDAIDDEATAISEELWDRRDKTRKEYLTV